MNRRTKPCSPQIASSLVVTLLPPPPGQSDHPRDTEQAFQGPPGTEAQRPAGQAGLARPRALCSPFSREKTGQDSDHELNTRPLHPRDAAPHRPPRVRRGRDQASGEQRGGVRTKSKPLPPRACGRGIQALVQGELKTITQHCKSTIFDKVNFFQIVKKKPKQKTTQ